MSEQLFHTYLETIKVAFSHLEKGSLLAPKLPKCKASGNLYLGQLKCESNKSLSALTSLLEAKRSKQMTVWFAPFDFHLDQGLLNMGRLDFLLGNAVHLCIWEKSISSVKSYK